ncbi:acetyl-CoA synthetase-like protein [Sparassis crispa]|uniref:Acetyl-CoA synthetase-like protein n=1 Tax=Sparassis crispa TaxID=139825 RepID=A0A401G6P4_9APHY|nr:acetyl-CoA synthetase-like protein [Sparassis crispa]GBE77841.1 acetyl-CoA synthetase-like protein [Sparassis crispa]
MVLKTHLSVLQETARLHSDASVFMIPVAATNGTELREWQSITYRQFIMDIEHCAQYWTRMFQDNLPQHSVIGLWLGGLTYIDAVHIYGIAWAGYIPQLFSLRLPNPEVIYHLMHRTGAQALIVDASFAPIVFKSPVPFHVAADRRSMAVDKVSLPPMYQPTSADETAMIFHTSGSTSGSPKLVPCSYKWLDAVVSKAWHVSIPKHSHKQDITVWMGSMCHIGQTFMLIGSLLHGACVIQPTTISFSSQELVDMIQRCGLNRLNQFASFLAMHLRASRQDTKVLALLQGLDEVLYTGLPLSREEEDWANRNGIQLKNLFGSTECGAMLLSIGGRHGYKSSFLRPIEGTSYGFFPISPASEESDGDYQDVNGQLLELVILSVSGDCPDGSLRQMDGHYHTGDLFQEIEPGHYISRGRDDDWIKSENALRCDTKAIEDNVRMTCADLVAECVVVGNGRPSPTLFVEPRGEMDGEKLRKQIVRRTRHFHSRRYLHERIASEKFIVVVPPNALPRTATKGNIRRRAVEEVYRTELDRIYG